MTGDTATTPEYESLYHRLLRTHPVYGRLKRQKKEVQKSAVDIERPSAATVISSTANKAANKAAAVNTSSTTAHVANCNNIDDDDDVITLDGIDDPEVFTQWEPINNKKQTKKQTQQHEFRWKIGDTVELQPDVEGSIFSDFAIIVGTNDDGTYNMKNILTGGWKKSVPANKIHGTYDDLIANSNSKSNSKANSSDGSDDSEDDDWDENEEETDWEVDDDSEEECQSSSECMLAKSKSDSNSKSKSSDGGDDSDDDDRDENEEETDWEVDDDSEAESQSSSECMLV